MPVNSLDQVFDYDGDNNALSNTVEYQGITYVQSYIRDGDNNVVEVTQYIPVPMFEYDQDGKLIKISTTVEINNKRIGFEKRIQRHANGKITITTLETRL